MIYTVNHREEFPKNPFVTINVTSHSTTWSRGLSPFFLGPVKLYDDFYALNVENAWQYCKVYPEYVDTADNIKKQYYQWAIQGWQNCYAVRYPMGKGAKPLFSLWDSERLTYIEARKKIYIPLYARAVVKTEEYRKLKEQYQQFGELWLLDFDVYRYDLINYTFHDVIHDETKKFGHGFVLAMLLENKVSERNNYEYES